MPDPQLEKLSETDKIRADLATGITMAVQATGVLDGADNATETYAATVMREELEAFCDPYGAYGEVLQECMKGTMDDGEALAMVVTTCIGKIKSFRETGLN